MAKKPDSAVTICKLLHRNQSSSRRCSWDFFENNLNCTNEYIEICFGSVPEWIEAITMTILYVIICAVAVIGNVLVCIVIVRHATMHSATNYYLFNLAMSDLIYLTVGVSNEISEFWQLYPYRLNEICCKLRAFVCAVCVDVSVLTIVAFSVERFLAICYPLHSISMDGFKRAVWIIISVWVISLLWNTPLALNYQLHYLYYPNNTRIEESARCDYIDPYANYWFMDLSSIIFFVIPLITLIVMYTRMGIVIYTRTKSGGVQNGRRHNESNSNRSRKAIIKMLALVVFTFFICWSPHHIRQFIYLHYQKATDIDQYLYLVSGILYYASCALNPVIYNVMSERYRTAFCETICQRKPGRRYTSVNGVRMGQRGSSVRETFVNESEPGETDQPGLSAQGPRKQQISKDRQESIKRAQLAAEAESANFGMKNTSVNNEVKLMDYREEKRGT